MNFIHCPKAAPRPVERWTQVHVPTPINPTDRPDESCDVFETVAEIEMQSLEFFNTNLIGNIVNTQTLSPIALAMQASGATDPKVFARPNYFCVLDTLEDNIGQHAGLHSRVVNSMAWMLDAAAINQARVILFARWNEDERTQEATFDAFCMEIAENLDHDSLYTGEPSNEQTLAQLLALRQQWHDAAQSAAAADNRDYVPKSLSEMMLAEKPRTASVGARTNFIKMAALAANGDEALEKRMYESMVLADAATSASRAEGNRQLMPTILEVLRAAARYAPSETRFDHLPERIQHRLTKAAIGVVERTMLDMAKRMGSEPLEFARLAEAAYKCTAALNAILADKFSQVGELEYAGMPPAVDNHNRQQKRVACSID